MILDLPYDEERPALVQIEAVSAHVPTALERTMVIGKTSPANIINHLDIFIIFVFF